MCMPSRDAVVFTDAKHRHWSVRVADVRGQHGGWPTYEGVIQRMTKGSVRLMTQTARRKAGYGGAYATRRSAQRWIQRACARINAGHCPIERPDADHCAAMRARLRPVRHANVLIVPRVNRQGTWGRKIVYV